MLSSFRVVGLREVRYHCMDYGTIGAI